MLGIPTDRDRSVTVKSIGVSSLESQFEVLFSVKVEANLCFIGYLQLPSSQTTAMPVFLSSYAQDRYVIALC